MRFLLLVRFALLFVCLGERAGAQTFNVRMDPHGQRRQETAWSVESNGTGDYIIIASTPFADSLFYSSVVTAIQLDQNGAVLNVDRAIDVEHATYPGWSNSTARRTEGGVVVGGGNFTTDSLDNWIQRPVLYFFDEEGHSEGYAELGPTDGSWIGRQAKQTPDGGFVICGETTVDGIQSDAFLIKTDAQGNEVWTMTYGGPFSDFSVAVDNRSSGGFYIGGERGLAATNTDLCVTAVDETGDLVWEQVWGSEFDEPNAHLTTAADGNILVASGWGYADNFVSRRYLAKLDALDGSFIWQQEFGAIEQSSTLFVVQEVRTLGDLIAAGGQTLPGNQFYGLLLRTTADGDSLWMRSYQYYDSLVSNGRGIFRDVVPTPDGGFIACGTALPVSVADTLLYTQDVWVVKTDSMGCIEPGCHLVTGVETQFTNLKDVLRVWPNPVVSGGSIQLELHLPEDFVPRGTLRVSVVSSDGRLVHEVGVPDKSDRLQLQVNLEAGLYHLHLSDDTRWISGTKLMVE